MLMIQRNDFEETTEALAWNHWLLGHKSLEECQVLRAWYCCHLDSKDDWDSSMSLGSSPSALDWNWKTVHTGILLLGLRWRVEGDEGGYDHAMYIVSPKKYWSSQKLHKQIYIFFDVNTKSSLIKTTHMIYASAQIQEQRGTPLYGKLPYSSWTTTAKTLA